MLNCSFNIYTWEDTTNTLKRKKQLDVQITKKQFSKKLIYFIEEVEI